MSEGSSSAADPETYTRPTRYAGLTPTPGELSAEYTDALGVAAPDLTWFQALASFKSAPPPGPSS